MSRFADWYNDDEQNWWGSEPNWDSIHEKNIWLDLVEQHPEIRNDQHGMNLIHEALFNMEQPVMDMQFARAEAIQYFDDTYEFMNIFDDIDWDEYRDWYEEAS